MHKNFFDGKIFDKSDPFYLDLHSEYEKDINKKLKSWIRSFDADKAIDFFKNTVFKHALNPELAFARIEDLFTDPMNRFKIMDVEIK